MVVSIPTFRLKITEGLIDVDTSADRLFGYCIEAPKGPVMEPTFVASAAEAEEMFGVNFKPHFYQKPTGLVICRVGFDLMKKASFTWNVNLNTDAEGEKDIVPAITIEAVDPGVVNHKFLIAPSLSNVSTYSLTVDINGVTSKKYQSLPNLKSIVKRINNKFGAYVKATLHTMEAKGNETAAERQAKFDKVTPSQLQTTSGTDEALTGELTGGSLGVYVQKNGELPTKKENKQVVDRNGVTHNVEVNVLDESKVTPIEGNTVDTTVAGTKDTDADANATLLKAYRAAFDKMKDVDILGLATLSRAKVVRNELIEHINEMNDPEVAQLRFGVCGFLDYPEDEAETYIQPVDGTETLCEDAREIDNEYIIYIGQGVVFEEDGVKRNLYPYQAVQLYTGIRSALGYAEAIFGGEPKKVLKGVVDVLPITTDNTILVKEDREDLNEAGVNTFKKEYDEITFLEGVTTVQDNDVLSHESIMSIVMYVTKRLIKVAKPYQGQDLTEDLKASLTTALSTELKNITDTDKTLISINEYNIPPYDVEVKSAAVVHFNEENELVRESKIIINCKIVPVGALRDIDLGVIVI